MTDTWTWATVTQASPLRIKVDGDTSALDATTDNLVGSLAVDDRVRVHLHADGIIVTGLQGGGDTGWVDINFRSGYEAFSELMPCQVRKLNGVVYLTGLLKPSSGSFAASTSVYVADLPTWAHPGGYLFMALGTTTGLSPSNCVIPPGGLIEVRMGPDSSPYVGLGGLSWPAA